MHFKANWGPQQGLYGVPRASYNIRVKETDWHFRLFKLCLLARCTWIPIWRAFHSIRTWLDWLGSTGLNLTQVATLTSVSTISVPPKSTVTSTSPSPSHSTSSFRSQGSKDCVFWPFCQQLPCQGGFNFYLISFVNDRAPGRPGHSSLPPEKGLHQLTLHHTCTSGSAWVRHFWNRRSTWRGCLNFQPGGSNRPYRPPCWCRLISPATGSSQICTQARRPNQMVRLYSSQGKSLYSSSRAKTTTQVMNCDWTLCKDDRWSNVHWKDICKHHRTSLQE